MKLIAASGEEFVIPPWEVWVPPTISGATGVTAFLIGFSIPLVILWLT